MDKRWVDSSYRKREDYYFIYIYVQLPPPHHWTTFTRDNRFTMKDHRRDMWLLPLCHMDWNQTYFELEGILQKSRFIGRIVQTTVTTKLTKYKWFSCCIFRVFGLGTLATMAAMTLCVFVCNCVSVSWASPSTEPQPQCCQTAECAVFLSTFPVTPHRQEDALDLWPHPTAWEELNTKTHWAYFDVTVSMDEHSKIIIVSIFINITKPYNIAAPTLGWWYKSVPLFPSSV